ncbi:MAG: sulfurtransferase [Cyanophyceae cyanobacterium]
MQNGSPLVDIRWLQEHLDDPNLVLVDTRFSLANPPQGRQQYDAGHIPKAVYLDLDQDLSGPIQSHGGRHPLPDWGVFSEKLSQIGIQSNPPTKVVVYDDSRFVFAARLWWMLRYLGHSQVAILDGGIKAWKAAGLPLDLETPGRSPGNFVPAPQTHWVMDIETVKQRKELPGVMLVDSRSPERYRGEVEPIDPVAGSIPGAANAFWQQVTTEEGYLKDRKTLAQHWEIFDLDEEVIFYCGSGVTACVNLFSLAAIGHRIYKLYPGGWSDWCSYQH